MTLRLYAHTLELKHAFTLARSTRTTTPIMLVELERDGIVGYGEASMPPYLGETHETARAFLSRVDLTPFDDLFQLEEILTWIAKLQPGQTYSQRVPGGTLSSRGPQAPRQPAPVDPRSTEPRELDE